MKPPRANAANLNTLMKGISMPKSDLTTIQFHDATLLVRRGDTPETTLVAMKPVVEGMGLDWGGQHKKLSSHPVLAQGVSVMEIPSAGGVQEVTALPLNRIHFWLATIQPNKIKDDAIRARVILFQTEAADALFNHFFGAKLADSHEITAADRNAIGGIVKRCAGVVIREELANLLPSLIEPMVSARLAEQNMMIRRGMTAGQIWAQYGLPRLKNGPTWLGNRLSKMGCQVGGNGRAELGGRLARVYDPDNVAFCMDNGLLHKVRVYCSERMGQGRLKLVEAAE
ncbi:MAG: hypothetical protein D1H97_16105 [Paracoccus sp. BP8]|nr:MAG: hypothetical protein D1H97_16105 [Paracoccus sp. BP8]